jgi:hypothetical protein
MRFIAAKDLGSLAIGLCLVAGCGAAAPVPSASSPPRSEGNEVAAPEPRHTEPAAAAIAEVERSGPAKVTVEAKVHGKAVPANVRLLGADGGEAASGKAGEPISVQSGEYEILVSITDPAALLDKPTQRRPLTVHPGDDLHEVAEFPWAMIQLNVMINGRSASGASVRLLRQGAEVGTLKSGADFTAISPGRYEAEVKVQGSSIEVHGLMFPEGATQTVPVNAQL